MKLRFFLTTVTAFGFLAAGLAPSADAATINAATVYTVTDLGNLGGNVATAHALAPDGGTAGVATNTDGIREAFVTNPEGMRVPVNTPGDMATASGINNSGQVSGTQWFDGQAYATLWGSTDATYKLLAGPGSYGNAINSFGQVTGMMTVGGEGHMFMTDLSNNVIDLGTMPGGAWSSGYGINNLGQIAGYAMIGSNAQAFVWDSKDGYTALQGLGGANSYAMGISDKGGIAGSAQLSTGYMHAVLWLNGIAQDLGTLGGKSSFAYGVNNLSQVVGYSFTANGKQHAFVYANGLLLDLNSLISPNSGWVLNQAYSINDAGQISGTGMLYGKVHAFRLDLYELLSNFGLTQPGGPGGPFGTPPGGGPGGPFGTPPGGGPGGNGPGGGPGGGPGSTLTTQATAVPEPGSAMLALAGVVMMLIGVVATRRRSI